MKTNTRWYKQSLVVWSAVSAILLLSTIFALSVPHTGSAYSGIGGFLSPLPERKTEPSKPPTWVFSGEGGTRRFGSVTIVAPVGFTRQSGADIRSFSQAGIEGVQLPGNLVPSTLFSLGVWPANDQTVFDKPLELRILVDPAQLKGGSTSGLQLVQYDPAAKSWKPVTSAFQPSTYQVVGRAQTLTPVAKDFPRWGGQTFFAIVQGAAQQGASQQGESAAGQSVLQSNANIRTGPGTTFAVARTARAGEALDLDGKTADGRWLRLAGGTWVAAFLVSNPPANLPVVSGSN